MKHPSGGFKEAIRSVHLEFIGETHIRCWDINLCICLDTGVGEQSRVSVETLEGVLQLTRKEKSEKKTEKGEVSGVRMRESMGTWFHQSRKRRVFYLSCD